jgi:AcrR family transcriptional regulator
MSKKVNKLDPRVLRTRQLLRDAIISLIPEMGYSAITIQDIADRATLNRTTFYLHYHDKNELLIDAFDEMMAHTTPLLPDEDISLDQSALKSIEFVFQFIAGQSDFFMVMLTQESVPAFYARLRDYIKEVGLKWFKVLQPEEEKIIVPPDISINFLGSAVLGVIEWWLQNDMGLSAEYMATQVMVLSVLGLHRSLGLEVPDLSNHANTTAEI